MIDLGEFKKMVEPAVWKRGKSYFVDGAVDNLEDDGNGHWEAIVSGNDDYEVMVDIQFGHVQEWNCDCPYDGDICKHVVAMVLAIQDEKKMITINVQENEPKPKTFEHLVAAVSSDELRSFVKQYAESDKNFKRAFKVSFAEKNPAGGKAQYTKLIAQSLRSAMGRHEFIDYYQTRKAFSTVFNLLDKANELLNRENYMEAWLIASAVVEQVSEVTGYIDDSDGVIGDSFEGAFNLISELADKAEVPMSLKEQMFDWHKTEYPKDKYQNYGDDTILDSMVDLAEVTNRTDEIFPILDSAIRKTTSEYELVSILKQKAWLLNSLGRIAEYDGLVNENLQYSEFRKIKLGKLLELKQYNEAEKLIGEGIRISENQHHGGTTRQWKEQLLEIYRKTSQKDKYLVLLRELFYASNRQYYPLLKQTIGTEKWPEELAGIIATLKKSRMDWNFLFELYAAEQMLPELLQLITQNAEFRLIKTYETYLLPKFQAEILNLYERVCEKFAARANARGDYQELASMLKHIQKLEGGKPVVTKLLTSFREIYKRRPAMMDELKRLH